MLHTRLVQGEFDALYRERWAEIVAQARTILRGRSDPADVAATAYTRLWAEISEGRAADLYDRLVELTTTEANAAQKRAQRELEYLGNTVEVTDEDGITMLVRESGTHAAEIAERLANSQPPTIEDVMFRDEFDNAVRSLTPKQRDAYILTDLRGLSYTEATGVLDITRQSVTERVTRARESIVAQLTEGGIA